MDWMTFFTIVAQVLVAALVGLMLCLLYVLARIALAVSKPEQVDPNVKRIRDRLIEKVRESRRSEDGEALPDGE